LSCATLIAPIADGVRNLIAERRNTATVRGINPTTRFAVIRAVCLGRNAGPWRGVIACNCSTLIAPIADGVRNLIAEGRNTAISVASMAATVLGFIAAARLPLIQRA